MKKQVILWLAAAGLILALGLTGCKRKTNPSGSTATDTDVMTEAMQNTADAGTQMLSEQKENFLKKAKENFSGLETKVNDLIASMQGNKSENWEKMKTTLQDEMQTAKLKLSDLTSAKSSQAWQDSQDQFTKALSNLNSSYEKAKSEFAGSK